MKFDKVHPHVKQNLPLWEKLRAAITGDGIENHLPRHPRESSEDFRDRKRAVSWRGYSKLALRIWTSALFGKPVARELPAALAELVPDTDRQGTPAPLFFKRTAEQALTYGVSFVQVDLPALPEGQEIKTMADAQAAGIRPYLISHPPQDILDWDHAPDGSINWVAIKDEIESDPQPMIENKPQEAVLILRPDGWERWKKAPDEKLELVDAGPHSFGQVPLIPFYAKRLAPFIGESPLVEITGLAVELMQAQSLLNIALGHAGLPRFVLFTANNLKGLPLPSGTRGNNGIALSPEDKASYLYLPSDAVKALQIEVDRLKADIRAATYFQLEQKKESAARESADKRRLDMSALHNALSDWASNFQDSETLVWELMSKGCPAPSMDRAEKSISYNKKFDLRSNAERLEEAISASTLDIPSPTFRRELHSQLAKHLLEDSPPEVVQQVVDELAAHAEF
jgi:hypothetical protein